ncbi:hypothetical protein [Mucilaginibacter segetis]|uniref:Molybdopterin-binding protein n=1 Tax=Mucilaginibacter segetis TaxID=2793071 RepID=A0A934UNF8_9SPHI|nr:hypothetical protein [Mucilaginibacter segetis]MBK0379867.1 hypothetical protein [Mucilaginibacter segetis]
MKKLLILFFLYAGDVFAQTDSLQTKQFTISGNVETESVITLDSLQQYHVKAIGDLNITDHTGKFKHRDNMVRGVLLKDILSHTKFKADSPKLLSRIYFVCTAADGYSVVYSWNELYNTAVGDHVFIITGKNKVKAADMPESIQMASTSDYKTGRRYIHNLVSIDVRQIK